jgi:hypothetical protein
MPNLTEVPTPAALADLVARCHEMQRYATELTAAEETRVAALAAGVLVMRQVLELPPVPAEKLPLRQARMSHWSLTGPTVEEAETPAVRALHGALVLDEHGQIKVLVNRTWRGTWRNVAIWRDGVEGLRANALMDYLARSEALVSTYSLLPPGPRSRGD